MVLGDFEGFNFKARGIDLMLDGQARSSAVAVQCSLQLKISLPYSRTRTWSNPVVYGSTGTGCLRELH